MNNDKVLIDLVSSIANASIEIIDLTETLTPNFPCIELPSEFGQAWEFKKEVISRYDENGPSWYWNNFSISEHSGTHFDAPVHWITGKDIENGSVDTLPTKDFIAPVCVVDCSKLVAQNKGFILTVEVLEAWEVKHGRIPAGSWLFMRSDWRHIADPNNYTNMQTDGAHSPGPDAEAVLWLLNQRNVIGFGSECIGTDAGQAFNFEPQFPCHHYMHGAGKYGLQCMTNLDKLPPTGAVIIAAPLKIEQGSGSPLRVVALVCKS